MNNDLIQRLTEYTFLSEIESVLIKRMSKNDISWAKPDGSNQSGFILPIRLMESNFFPKMKLFNGTKKVKENIGLKAQVHIIWTLDENPIKAEIKKYATKKSELQITGLNKTVFSRAYLPCFLVLLKLPNVYYGYIISVDDDGFDFLEGFFEIDDKFKCKVFDKNFLEKKTPVDAEKKFLNSVVTNYNAGLLSEFLQKMEKLPEPSELAQKAREIYLKKNNLANLNPFEIANIGDRIKHISRDLEYKVFRYHQNQINCVSLILKILGTGPLPANSQSILESLVKSFGLVDSLFLSASQQRKSRAGYSFEHHIENVFKDGNVPYERHIFEGSKPDFVIPSRDAYYSGNKDDNIILSVKTTLRERWRQVLHEGRGQKIYLATVDNKVSIHTLSILDEHGIVLVVPEAMKNSKKIQSKYNSYADFNNVITFDDFFRKEVKRFVK